MKLFCFLFLTFSTLFFCHGQNLNIVEKEGEIWSTRRSPIIFKPNIPISDDHSIYFEYQSRSMGKWDFSKGIPPLKVKKRGIYRVKNNYYKFDYEELKFCPVRSYKKAQEIYETNYFSKTCNPLKCEVDWNLTTFEQSKNNVDLYESNIALSLVKNGIEYSGNVIYENEHTWVGPIISDEKADKILMYTEDGSKENFLKLFFIAIDDDKKELISSAQTISYNDLGFNYETLELVNSNKSFHTVNEQVQSVFFFIIDSTRLGLSTVYFDLKNQLFEIRSEEIMPLKKSLLNDLQGINFQLQNDENGSYYIVDFRYKNSVNQDLYIFSVFEKSTELEVIQNARSGLIGAFKNKDASILIYRQWASMNIFDYDQNNLSPNAYSFYDVVLIRNDSTYRFRQPLFDEQLANKNKIFRIDTYVDQSQNIADGIKLLFILNGNRTKTSNTKYGKYQVHATEINLN